MHLNRVMLIGNVCRDPEIRFAGPSQVPVTDIRLAINRVWKNVKGEKREDHVFIDVVAWARQAELAVQYLKKGRLIGVDGHLQMDEWTGTDGKKNTRIKVVSERIVYLPQGNVSRDSGAPPAADAEPETDPSVEEEARIPA
jgi:single-strand DNA-binding protein